MAPLPAFYDPRRIGTLFHPDAAAIAAQAEAAGLPPADEDRRRTMLLIIDMQVDFCHPQIDFQAVARSRFSDFEAMGVRLASSADPL